MATVDEEEAIAAQALAKVGRKTKSPRLRQSYEACRGVRHAYHEQGDHELDWTQFELFEAVSLGCSCEYQVRNTLHDNEIKSGWTHQLLWFYILQACCYVYTDRVSLRETNMRV